MARERRDYSRRARQQQREDEQVAEQVQEKPVKRIELDPALDPATAKHMARLAAAEAERAGYTPVIGEPYAEVPGVVEDTGPMSWSETGGGAEPNNSGDGMMSFSALPFRRGGSSVPTGKVRQERTEAGDGRRVYGRNY